MISVVTKYPLPVRVSAVFVCGILAIAGAGGSVSVSNFLVALGAACLGTAVMSYRAEVNTTEIRIRYVPFYTKRTPLRDVIQVLEERTVVLVTPTARIPPWGLSAEAREELFLVLPSHLHSAHAESGRPADSAAVIRRHIKRTIFLTAGFFITAALSIPFLSGNPWYQYANQVGRYVLLLCLCLLLLLLLQAGITWSLWSYKRDIDRIEGTRYGHDCSLGQVTSITDPNNSQTTAQYGNNGSDVLDRLSSVVRPNNQHVVYSYSSDLTTVTTGQDQYAPNDQVLKSSAITDLLGKTIETRLYTSPSTFLSTKTDLDALGRPKKAYNPGSTSDFTTYTYDALGRPLSTQYPDGSQEMFQWSGDTVLHTDPAGKQTDVPPGSVQHRTRI